MYIKAKNDRIASTPRLSGPPSIQGGKRTFGACLKATEIARNRASNAPRIKLGTLSATQPTVSHLLANHPVYGGDCWEIIHSDMNRDKPYTRIPAGTTIYLDPQTDEIFWDFSGRTPPEISKLKNGDVTAAWSDHHGHPASPEYEMALIEQAVSAAADAYDLPRHLISGVIKAESDFQVRAVSPAGARGLMQLMPETAKELGVDNPFDIRQNIDGGARYLKKMIDLFDGDIEQALAAYNAGPGTIKRSQGRIPYPETRVYVQRVLSFSNLNSKI